VPVDGDALREWSHWHDGYDPRGSRLVSAWLSFVHALAGPLARLRVPPTLVTAAGVAAAAGAVVTPRAAAAGLVATTAVCDGVDGAVAIRRRMATARGETVDHVADRTTDALFGLALWRAGAPAALAAASVAATLAYESGRTRLRRDGDAAGLVTMGERPMRVVVVVAALVMSPTVGAAAVTALCAGAGAQLMRASRAGARTRSRRAVTAGHASR
jgi:CDP-diacylglycerol--glycerol-3-phosphate 3-phosphatidyltransferase